MNITFFCPSCEQATRVELADEGSTIECPLCSAAIDVPSEGRSEGRLNRCLVCPSTDLFARKDFPQRLGVAIVVVGIVGSTIAWAYTQWYWTFGILFATALIDLVLYTLVGNQLMCYRCHAEYRGVVGIEGHGAFDLETHERYRQSQARLEKVRS